MSQPQYFVYFLQAGRRSYIGFTVNLVRRLRQHRGELKGGAKYTASWPRRHQLVLVAYVTGFPDQRTALSYEWHAKRARASAQTFLPTEATHRRLPGFFYPATQPRFANDVTPLLSVVLFQHHALAPLLDQLFHLPRVQCCTESEGITPSSARTRVPKTAVAGRPAAPIPRERAYTTEPPTAVFRSPEAGRVRANHDSRVG